MDKKSYDDPEDRESRWGRAVMLLAGAGLLLLIFIAFATGNTPIRL